MSGSSDIASALKARLVAISPGAAIAQASIDFGEGIVFAPTTGQAWYRVTLLTGEPRPAALGDTAQNRHVGVFQISVFWPTGQTGGRAEAERIADCYKRGTGLVYSGQVVQCEKAWLGTNAEDTDFVHWPVKVMYWADVPN